VLLLWKEGENMWLLVLILSIKLQMPTWYWIIFTIITILRPFVGLFCKILQNAIDDTIKEIETPEKIVKDEMKEIVENK
jgi:hypothetical protein